MSSRYKVYPSEMDDVRTGDERCRRCAAIRSPGGPRRYNSCTERDSEKRCERATKGMSGDPYIRINIEKHQGYVVIKVLRTQERESAPDSRQVTLTVPTG